MIQDEKSPVRSDAYFPERKSAFNSSYSPLVYFQIYKVLRYLCQLNTSLQNKIMSDLGELAAIAGLELLRYRILLFTKNYWPRKYFRSGFLVQ